jgi:hypothetical protein
VRRQGCKVEKTDESLDDKNAIVSGWIPKNYRGADDGSKHLHFPKDKGRDWLENSAQANFGQYPAKATLVWSAQQRFSHWHSSLKVPINVIAVGQLHLFQ